MSEDQAKMVRRGDELIWSPSGLRVKALEIHFTCITVEAPKGGRFSVLLSHLERVAA